MLDSNEDVNVRTAASIAATARSKSAGVSGQKKRGVSRLIKSVRQELTALTTKKKERKAPMFLKELRANGGFVGKACEAVGVSKQGVHNWRESDPEFADDWDQAVELATEDLEKEARRRAYEGVEEPVFYQGEECGRIRKYSDTLLMFTIKSRKPEYRDRITLDVKQLDADIEREMALIAARRQADITGEAESDTIN
jgi:hypothetical protein